MLTRYLAVSGATVMLVLAGCANPNGPAGDYGSVAGAVTDMRTGTPIAGANVCIFVVECQPTANDGTYKIPTVPSDPAGMVESVTATAPGYQTATQSVHITSGQQSTVNFALTHT